MTATSKVGTLFTILLIVACATVGFYELFSNFRPYDDEGLFMLSNQLFLGGHIPYKEITWLFGPAQLVSVQLLHDFLGIPIEHSAIRFITMVQWLLLCTLAGLLVAALTRSLSWGLAGIVLAFLYTTSIVNEPGHPQVLVAIASLAIPVIPALLVEKKPWLAWFLVGIATALVFYIKINAGAFCLAAVGVVLLAQWRPPHLAWLMRWLLVVGSLAAPFLLMAPLLATENALGFALISGASVVAVAIVAVSRLVPGPSFQSAVLASALGFVLFSAIVLAYAASHGIGILDIVVSLGAYAAEQVGFYHYFREYSWLQVGLAGVALVCAIGQYTGGDWARRLHLLLFSKIWFVLAASFSLVTDDAAHSQTMLAYAGPWCWLVAYGPGRDTSVTISRLLLAALAAWSPLLAYPMPGTQLYLGCLPILLAALVCAADILTAVQLNGRAARWTTSLVGAGGWAVLLIALVALLLQYQSALQRYAGYQLLALPGTGPLRIEPGRAGHYRKLVAQANRYDVLVTTFRFNSLYFWSSARIPGPAYLSQWQLALSSPAAQQQSRAGLREAVRPLVISRQGRLTGSPVAGWLQEDFKPYRRIGPYTLMRRRGAQGSSGSPAANVN